MGRSVTPLVTHSQDEGRRAKIVQDSVGLDYERYKIGLLAWDYEGLMRAVRHSLAEITEIQRTQGVGRTPLHEAHNITALIRSVSPPGCGARIFIKDEAANPSGSFKDRRASISVFEAQQRSFEGVIAATSGNYGAAVASQAARAGLRCIVAQEAFDSNGVGQPEILEKARACEEFGAEVVQGTVGPELFDLLLNLLAETGYFNASLYTPYSVAGIETLGAEVAGDLVELTGRPPDAVVVTHAGGGNVTGTARGLQRAGATETSVVGASIDLTGLHMASDSDFNRKSFTTGHSGFSIPFTVRPDRSDVPLNAARPLRYLDQLVLVTQGEAFYATEVLARLEGMQRGPTGNTSLAAAMVLAKGLPADATVVVQETEYTGAGKHPWAQLEFALNRGVEVRFGDRSEDRPGHTIVIPQWPEELEVTDVDLRQLRRSYLQAALRDVDAEELARADWDYLAEETGLTVPEAQALAEEARPVHPESSGELGRRR